MEEGMMHREGVRDGVTKGLTDGKPGSEKSWKPVVRSKSI